jgi:hypothetical protein
MIVRIGVSDTPKEIEVDMADDTDGAGVRSDIESAVGAGAGMLWLTDRHGRQVGVPAARIAYVDLGTSDSGPRIGFGA